MKKVRLFLYVLIVFFSTGCDEQNKASLTVINQSGEVVTSLSVKLFGQEKSQSTMNLKNEEEVVFVFYGFSDSHYVVKGELDKGDIVQGEFGYITNGADFEDALIIKKGGTIEFISKPIQQE